MIIFKPDWVTHSDIQTKSCIFTLDVSPDGTCLATGSHDGTIKIWNTLPIYNEEAEKNSQCPKLLFTLLSHQGAVLCLRWSNDNRYLASSSDRDNTIIIWEKRQGQWEPKHQLKEHSADIQGLQWSRDNDYLASCSADGSVIVWDGYTFEKTQKIVHCSGRVNGIVWDPTGQYLASQADDKTIKIWRTSDWNLDTTIRNPFFHTPNTALFTRLSWSPEGQHIAAANASNSHKPVAAIISRDDWGSDVSLVGHRHPVEITSFNPKLFYMNEESSIEGVAIKSISSICALGSQDRSVSIWMTKSSKPICVTTDLFSDNIYDIAWAPDGRSLFACSRDGTVVCLQLPEELEDDVPDEIVMSQLVNSGYGKHLKKKPTVLQSAPPSFMDLTVETSLQTPPPIQPSSAAPLVASISATEANIPNTLPDTNKSKSVKDLEETNLGTKRKPTNEEETVEETKQARTRPLWTDSAVIPPIVKSSQVKMALPKLKSTLIVKGKESTFQMECHNTPNDTNAIQSNISLMEKTNTVWTDCLSSLVILMTTTRFFSAASCEDGSIHTWSPAGKRLLPAIVLDSPAVLLQSMDAWLVCITATGLMYSWDLANLKSCLEGITIAPILHVAQLEIDKSHEAPSIKTTRIQKNGLPMVITSSHQAFVYHLNMKVWLRVSDAWYVLSEFWGTSARKADHPLAWLSLHNQGPSSSQMYLDMSAATKVVTLSHIETQLAVAALLDSPLEYKDWMVYYVRRLSEENAKHKVEELCKWLVGPPYSPSSNLTTWEPTILGKISKKELLAEILPLLAKNRQLQRTIQEFSFLLKKT